jgi:hypothetical protein
MFVSENGIGASINIIETAELQPNLPSHRSKTRPRKKAGLARAAGGIVICNTDRPGEVEKSWPADMDLPMITD